MVSDVAGTLQLTLSEELEGIKRRHVEENEARTRELQAQIESVRQSLINGVDQAGGVQSQGIWHLGQRLERLEEQMKEDVAETARRIHSSHQGLTVSLDSAVISLEGRCEDSRREMVEKEIKLREEFQELTKREVDQLAVEFQDEIKKARGEVRPLIRETEEKIMADLDKIPGKIAEVKSYAEGEFIAVQGGMKDLRAWEIEQGEEHRATLENAIKVMHHDIAKVSMKT